MAVPVAEAPGNYAAWVCTGAEEKETQTQVLWEKWYQNGSQNDGIIRDDDNIRDDKKLHNDDRYVHRHGLFRRRGLAD